MCVCDARNTSVYIYFVMGMLLFVRTSQSFGFFYERLLLAVAQNPGRSIIECIGYIHVLFCTLNS